MPTTTKKASKPPVRLAAPLSAPDRCQDVDAEVERLRQASIARARELLRVKTLPNLECAILATPSGPVRNRLTAANILLLKALEELQA